MQRDKYVFLTGGLGNQLFQIAASINGSTRSFLCANPENGRKNRNKFLDATEFIFDPKVQFCEKPKLDYVSLRAINYLLRYFGSQKWNTRKRIFNFFLKSVTSLILTIKFKKIMCVYPNLGLGFDQSSVFSKKRRVFLIGYFQSFTFVNNPEVLRIMKGIRLAEEPKELDSYLELANQENPLVVHIRLGDYLEADNFGVLNIEYYAQAIETAFKSGKYKRIWLFSDSPKLAIKYIPVKYSAVARIMPDFENSTALTFEVMRLGKGYVIANSTFSWWAATISRAENPDVYYPEPWFKKIESPLNLNWPGWQRIPAWINS